MAVRNGKTVVITGAGGGIGRPMAQRMAQAGAAVVVVVSAATRSRRA